MHVHACMRVRCVLVMRLNSWQDRTERSVGIDLRPLEGHESTAIVAHNTFGGCATAMALAHRGRARVYRNVVGTPSINAGHPNQQHHQADDIADFGVGIAVGADTHPEIHSNLFINLDVALTLQVVLRLPSG